MSGASAGAHHLAGQDRADGSVRFWTPAQADAAPMPTGVLNVLDVRGQRPDPRLLHDGAAALLVDCDEAAGAWAMLTAAEIVVVPPVVEPAAAASGDFLALHLVLGAAPSAAAVQQADAAAAWARARRIACGVCDSGLATVARLGAAPPLRPGAAVIDLRSGPDRAVASLGLLGVLGAGGVRLFAPALTQPSPGGRGLQGTLETFAGMSKARRKAASAESLAFVRREHARARAEVALARLRAREPEQPRGNVLVVSDEALNLLDIRVHAPFSAMQAQGIISGYSVLRHGQWAFGAPAPGHTFGSAWVQRSFDPLVKLFLQALGQPYVYDLDDLLLVSPSYRPAFPAESASTVRGLIAGARVFSCATGRLAALAQKHGAEGAVRKAVVTPNLAADVRAAVGAARCVVWASSDAPALAGSRREVERAVRDFCVAHGLKLLCLGAPPPPSFRRAGIAVEHVGLLSYPAYLARLRDAAPGILVGPLETGAEGPTQDFIDAKSDIKVIEALQAGLVGVFSRAAPYLESDLAPSILCENDYRSWLDGLEQARALCARPRHVAVPDARSLAGSGVSAWAEALRRARCSFTAEDVAAAVGFVRAQGETLLRAPERFDEADYLRRHADVRDAVRDGVVASGYRHFVQSGFREGREARRIESGDAADEFWWGRLLHRVARLEAHVPARWREIAAWRDRGLAKVAPAMATRSGVDWAAAGEVAGPCPVCDAAGPHAVALAFMGERLARCARCGSCFYADRLAYDYQDPAHAGLLLQLNLEQNAGIHQQTRPLFAVEDADSLLDVGCGFGFAVDLARQMGWRAVGLDPSFYAAAGAAQLGADLRQEYLTEATDLGAPFALVTASEVIEHVPEPYRLLALLRRQVRKGGTLVLSTPDAAAIRPEHGESRLLGILAPRVHLVLFTRDSLALALQRAGFRHVRVDVQGDGLLATASDRPLRTPADAVARHDAAYPRYLRSLLDRAEAGSALWNGAAGRLLAWLEPGEESEALFAQVDRAWRRFGIDLERGALPEMPRSAAELAAVQPFDLAGVLLARAARRGDLKLARAAYRVAVATGLALHAANMVDHDLRQTARRARMMVLDALAAMAPEMEAALLQGLIEASPGRLGEWIDPPAEMAAPRLALAFAAAVGADRFDDARRLEPAIADLDALCRRLEGHDEILLRALFALGVLRMVGDADPGAALLVFQRMRGEALARASGGPAIADCLELAERHIALASELL